ncbi:organic solvent tolerance protein OstA, partial [Mariniblastus sp.]|nr:organic solvent tolerance protein OstA [Mariniblastus sp.]
FQAPQNGPLPAAPAFAPSPTTPAQAGGQLTQGGSPFKILLSRRDPSVSLDLKNFVNPNNPNEKVTLLTGGIRLAIETPAISDLQAFKDDAERKLFVAADNAVQWQLSLPDGTRRNQFYLEGDVVFSKGPRVINAQRMFYDVESQQGTILKADMRANVSGINGPVRVKADVVQQLGENNIQAYGAAVTTSRIGKPRYWIQSEAISLSEKQVAPSTPVFDPNTGVAATNLSQGLSNFQRDAPSTDFTLSGQRNRVYVGGVPVFAWPRFQTTLSDPTLYLESFSLNNDNIFGTQVRTGFDLNQILGIESPGTRWIGHIDYLSERGLALGTEYSYQRDELFGIPGRVRGGYESWYINDDGTDNLGLDRPALIPEEDTRGRTILQHRHDFAPGYQLRAELGFISDRNFLEQFYEREWDTYKDATTGFWLERNVGTNSFNLTGDLQINDFFAQTSGINYNQFKLGQPIFNNRAIWHANAHAGYQRLRQADAPEDPVDAAKFDPLAWEADVDGFTAGTRQEIDFPMQIGPAKVVPYLLGDVSYWQEALDGSDLARAYGQVGVRASVPMWRVDPSIKSLLWNVDGLAHKVSFDVDAFFSEATQDLDELPLYNQLDDDSQEHFRRRFAFDTFNISPGGDTPLQFDERYFALRSGMQSNITAASSEIADDLMLVKLGVRQKWQTKRGLPGQQRIIDWITLDTQATLFPRANRDNFGSDFGMFDYDFRWYVGDRLSFVSDGYFDFFSQGLRTASFGANIGRPGNGNAYVGFRTIEGPISSNILSASMSYRMSDKWGVKAGGQVDFGETGTIGQTLSLIYIGESFLWQFGFNYDRSRDNFGFRFGFEPRFTRNPQLFRPGGEAIPPAGSRYLE